MVFYVLAACSSAHLHRGRGTTRCTASCIASCTASCTVPRQARARRAPTAVWESGVSGVAAKAFQPAVRPLVCSCAARRPRPGTPHADRRVKLPHQAAGGGKKRTRRSLAGSAVLDSPPFQTSDGFGRSTIGARFVLCISSITTRWRPPCPAPADARRAPPCAAGRPFHRGASAPPSDRGP